jgi:hypothetical protein
MAQKIVFPLLLNEKKLKDKYQKKYHAIAVPEFNNLFLTEY